MPVVGLIRFKLDSLISYYELILSINIITLNPILNDDSRFVFIFGKLFLNGNFYYLKLYTLIWAINNISPNYVWNF